MELATLLLVLSLITVSIYFHVQNSNSKRRKAGGKFPPGPYPFPIIGNIHQLGKSPHRTIAKLCKTYGPIMSLKLGTRSLVIVSSPELAKEVLLKHDQICSGRAIPVAAQAQDLYKQSMGFLPVTSNEWKKLRKIYKEQLFSTHRLDASQDLRREKVKQLCDYLEECCVSGRAVNIEEAAFTTTLNLMSSTLFSVDFGNYDDPNSSTQKLKEAVQGVVNSVSSPNLADYFPILRIIDPQGLKKRAEFCFGKLLAIFEDLINQRLESRQNGSPKKSDLLETLLDQREQYDISLREIKYILFDLFVAGADTTSGVVDWVMTELLLNPKELSNVKNELTSVIGDNKQVEESDISRLPYLQAVIKEVFRYHPPGPLLIPHRAEADIEINGFMIPKKTDFFINLWSMGRDSSLWPNPDSFEPGRFINRKIDFMGTNYELLPFGSGRRICPGLPLANRMLHLMMAALLHNFNWKLEPGMTPQELDVSDKFALSLRRVVPLKAVPYKI